MNRSIFPILAFNNKNPDDYIKERVDSGTGFFINSEGVFISAGHVFKNTELHYCALLNESAYPIIEVYREYKEQCDQNLLQYHDLFIGRINADIEISYIPLSRELDPKAKYSPTGYSSLFLERLNTDYINLDEIDYESELEEFDPEVSKELQWYDHTDLAYDFKSRKMKRDSSEGGPTYNNGFTIDMKGMRPHGLSGGPVMSNGTAKGIVVTENNCISMNYIISKLDKLELKYWELK